MRNTVDDLYRVTPTGWLAGNDRSVASLHSELKQERE